MLKVKWASAALPFLVAAGLQANCGLNFCPRNAETEGDRFEAGLAVNRTGFDLNGHGGQYTEVVPEVQYSRNGQLLLGLHVPVAGLEVEGDTHWGLENPLAYGEWRMHPGMGNMVSLGLQVEIPFGDHENGLASHHLMLVPYAAFGKGMDPWFLSATVGYSAAISLHEEDSGDVEVFHYVHPHEDAEFLYRVGAGLSLMDKRANPEIFLNGQHVMVDEKETLAHDDDLTAGIRVPVKFDRVTVGPRAEFSLLSAGRFDWTAGLEARFGI